MIFRRRRWIWFLLFLLACVALAWAGVAWWPSAAASGPARYVGRKQCVACHEPEAVLWAGSDHDRAMDLATPQTVLGAFDDREATHFDAHAKMSRRGDAFFVTTDNRQGQPETFAVKYVFGVRPLQQYLVEFPDGRVQCLPWAWDTERKRWFHLYPDEPIPHDDPLHWTRPLQNWNYMCAECHTTELRKNYDVASDTYHTTFREIDVSCETCHGPGSRHEALVGSTRLPWSPAGDSGLACVRGGDARTEIETCAPCHSRRRIIYPDYLPGQPYLDYYVPELLDTPMYFPDGQILEEDYEYSSFLQSRMYREKVRCSNCHDPHSMRVKFLDNRLCGQCHLSTRYDTPKHHHHPDASKPGTLCVDCHMPERTYMVVDPRRDHSLRMPRPDLSVDLGVPNVCTGCHKDAARGESSGWHALRDEGRGGSDNHALRYTQGRATPGETLSDDAARGESDAWAARLMQEWYGPRKEPKHFAYAIAAGRAGRPEGQRLLVDLLRRSDPSVLVRASALLLLAPYGTPDAQAMLRQHLDHAEGLVRMAAVRGLETAGPETLRAWVAPLLRDPIRAVRIEAARLISRLPRGQLNREDRAAFDAALTEYMHGQRALSDQPPAHLSMGILHENLGDFNRAEADYRTALRLDETFVPAHVNLAMLHDRRGRKADAETQLRRAIELAPTMADVPYSLGLLLAEDETRLEEAATWLERAAKLAPDRPRIHFNHGLALQKLGRAAEAEAALVRASRLAPGESAYVHALAILHLQERAWAKALDAAEALVRLLPDDPAARQLLDEIQRRADRGAK